MSDLNNVLGDNGEEMESTWVEEVSFNFGEISREDLLDEDYLRIIFNKVDRENNYSRLVNVCNYLCDVAREFDGLTESFVRDYLDELLSSVDKRNSVLDNQALSLEWAKGLKADTLNTRYNAKREEAEKKRRLEMEEVHKSIREVWGDELYDKVATYLAFDKNGNLDARNVVNYDMIVQHDPWINKHLKFNELTHSLEWDGEVFTNVHLLDLVSYFDRVFHIHEDTRIANAVARTVNVASYNPVKDLIEAEEWDGVPRIDKFFYDICKVRENITSDMKTYHIQVARMLFFGGINRLHNAGCKFDYMVILKGHQGTCKTTLAHLLALNERAYAEVTTMDGQEAIECITGAWVCEVAELLALTRVKDVQAIKAFTTRQFDKYRPPYARLTETIPRSCIFVGTTNDSMFLNDATGNRRYLPVEVFIDAEDFYNRMESEIKPYILQCWREALHMYKKGKAYYAIPAKHNDLLERVRSYYTDDDPIEGVIREYIANLPVGAEVCGLEIYLKCYNGIRSKFTNNEGRKIAAIVNQHSNMQYSGERKYFKDYGRQRYWKKVQ